MGNIHHGKLLWYKEISPVDNKEPRFQHIIHGPCVEIPHSTPIIHMKYTLILVCK